MDFLRRLTGVRKIDSRDDLGFPRPPGGVMVRTHMDAEVIESVLPEKPLLNVEGVEYPHLATGKVRELFDLGDRLLMVATDRISAFDVILPQGIPGKGILLTQISLHWFRLTGGILANHLLPDQDRLIQDLGLPPELRHRGMVVRKLKPLPVEAVVRGYLAGSGWQAYKEGGEITGHPLPEGLREADELPQPLFTPSTKATAGHDQPISEEECAALIGMELFSLVRDTSLRLYEYGRKRSRLAGMILADTKFEFGLDDGGNLFLIDEMLTPDSSRYWPAEEYQPGRTQPSYDKQFVRDFLLRSGWDRTPPAPDLPADVIAGTRERYLQALRNLA